MIKSWLAWRRADAHARILDALDRLGPLSGYPLSRATGLRVGRLYAALERLQDGPVLIEAEWGERVPEPDGPRRRLYRLTERGREAVELYRERGRL